MSFLIFLLNVNYINIVTKLIVDFFIRDLKFIRMMIESMLAMRVIGKVGWAGGMHDRMDDTNTVILSISPLLDTY